MSKKLFRLLSVLTILSLCITGCGSSSKSNATKAEIVLVTATGTIDDKSFNQGSWEGVKEYATEHNMEHKYYESPDSSTTTITSTLELAIAGGAKVIVCPGYLFAGSLYNIQERYPDVTFLHLDGTPSDDNGNELIGTNVASFLFAEEQAGFLAGYAAVMDGNRNLGFMGGIAVPAVVRFGYGFIQGAEYAAKELGLNQGDVSIKYTYVGNYDATPENQAKAAAWYNDGTEVIFACGGNLGSSVMSAAEATGKKVIGVDIDQSNESSTVITSAMKNLSKTVYDALTDYYNQTLTTGVCQTLDATTNSILLPMDTSVFSTFTQEQYDNIYADLAAGKITVLNNTTESATELPIELVTIEEIH